MSSDSNPVGEAHSSDAPAEQNELVVSPALRRKLQQCFDHATKLSSQEKFDFDYVSALLASCVQGDPGNLIYVDAFLDNLQRKYEGAKKGRPKGFGGKSAAVKKAATKSEWKEVFKLGPEALKANPWDVVALRALAEACEAYAFNEVELRYLKNALDANPKDPDVNRHCAESLARMGQFDQAIGMLASPRGNEKGNAEAQEMISRLTLERNRERAGIPRERGTAPVVKALTRRLAGITRIGSAPKAATGEAAEGDGAAATPARREIPLTERQKLEQATREFQRGFDNYMKLAELHIAAHHYAEAERTLHKAMEVSGGVLKTRELLEDVQLLRMKEQAALADQRAAEDGTAASHELATQMRAELNRRELELLAARSERYPQDGELEYELGLRLKRSGNYAEAIKVLQAARETPERKASATLEMGECLQQLRQFGKAQTCYDRAVDLAEAGSEFHKLALYRAGTLALGMKDAAKARTHLWELAQLDGEYKDVKARLDKLAGLGNTA